MNLRARLSMSLLFCNLAFSQINFESEKVILEQYQTPSLNSEIIIEDLNGDNQKDLISISLNLGLITLYQNSNGDFTFSIPTSILQNQSEYPSGVSVIDIDNDGLKDIITSNYFGNKINWFRNLGNFTFSPMAILMNITNGPNRSYICDVDYDGINDIVLNLNANDSVVWLRNNGNGTFMNPQIIYTTNAYNITKLVCRDLNNDNLPEVIIGDENSNVYWQKNLGNGVFGIKTQLANANSGISFEFEDINNDGFKDYLSTSGTSLLKKISAFGNSFGITQSNILSSSFSDIKFKDIDEDGLTDLVGLSSSGISYLKRFSDGTFGSYISLISVTPINCFIADDLNNDSKTDFIISSYDSDPNDNDNTLLSYINNSSNSYSETIISFYNSFTYKVKVADIDNDGKKDIISSLNAVVWNKNKGNGEFTSYKKISNYTSTLQTYDIEVVDVDNDNDLDVVAARKTVLEVHYNDGNGNFSLGYSLPLQYNSFNIEVVNINNDLLKDIVLTFGKTGPTGLIALAWIPNLTGTTFGSLTTIGLIGNYYTPYLIECQDMDNDNDIDIVSYSSVNGSFHLHQNNGSGIFTINAISAVSNLKCIKIEDFDNDGDKDIFGGIKEINYTGIYLIKNNGMPSTSFESPLYIQNIKADDINFIDLNEDGFKDLIGVYTISGIPDISDLYYLINNNGISFENKISIDLQNTWNYFSLLAIDDLNDDNKKDIVVGYNGSTKYTSFYLNSSTLSIVNNIIPDELVIYPVPFTEKLNWEIPKDNSLYYDVNILDEFGKLIYCEKKISKTSIDLCFLSKGVYVIKLKSDSKEYSRKIIKN
ncbi:MAG: FG-GAP-like repeat-containing protein [Flavobacterium sp.]|uniref:FG-GAP-like repeat-containing protein n=1 Tax=Flavobacterium sp. TaxID=239 RepID=UPI0022BE0897|nr:FG-GAP-like repeat-containing protein [Flavobacterium sp.]MCZ8196702.1 FG-GAP-like repeat-containing protein [Flavobacterium sp.]